MNDASQSGSTSARSAAGLPRAGVQAVCRRQRQLYRCGRRFTVQRRGRRRRARRNGGVRNCGRVGNVATSTRCGAMPAAVDEAAGAAAIAAGDVHLVPVKNHVRQAPGEKQKPPLTLDRLVKEYATEQRQTTERAIRLGRLSDAWIRVQGERPEHLKLDRSSAVKAICRALVEAKVDRRGAR